MSVFTIWMEISDSTRRTGGDDVPMSMKLILHMDVPGFHMKKVILWGGKKLLFASDV